MVKFCVSEICCIFNESFHLSLTTDPDEVLHLYRYAALHSKPVESLVPDRTTNKIEGLHKGVCRGSSMRWLFLTRRDFARDAPCRDVGSGKDKD